MKRRPDTMTPETDNSLKPQPPAALKIGGGSVDFKNVGSFYLNGGSAEVYKIENLDNDGNRTVLWKKPGDYNLNFVVGNIDDYDLSYTTNLFAGTYFAIVVGGGGGGSWSDTGSDNDGYIVTTGGSGSAVYGYFTLNSYAAVSIVVGRGGRSSGATHYHDDGGNYGTAGGASSLTVAGKGYAIAYAGGGGYSHDTRGLGYISGGRGGGTPENSGLFDTFICRNGNNGIWNWSGWVGWSWAFRGDNNAAFLLNTPYTNSPMSGVTVPDTVYNWMSANIKLHDPMYPHQSFVYITNPLPISFYGRSGGNTYWNGSVWTQRYLATGGFVGIWRV